MKKESWCQGSRVRRGGEGVVQVLDRAFLWDEKEDVKGKIICFI